MERLFVDYLTICNNCERISSLYTTDMSLHCSGRAYIGQSEPMMKEMISRLKKESEKTACGENLLGAMQKLSLRLVVLCKFPSHLS